MKKFLFLMIFGLSSIGLISQSCPSGGGGTSGTGSISSTVGAGGNSINSSLSGLGSSLSTLNQLRNVMSNMNYASVQDQYASVEGSPFVYGEETKGHLVLNNGSTLENLDLKFDAFSGSIIYTNPKDEEVVLESGYFKEMILEVDGEEKTFKKVNANAKERFCEVLYQDGEMVFFKNMRTTIREGRELGITKIPSKFTNRSEYYISTGEDHIAKVNLKKRDMFEHFPEAKAIAYREYVKKNGIKLKKEKDYLAMFASID